MKSLKTLVKFHKQQLEALQRQMVAMQGQKEQLLQLTESLKSELARELALAESDPDMAYFLGDFSKKIRGRIDGIHRDVAGLDKLMEALRDNIREAFAEQKKFEIALENRQEEERLKTDRRETAQMDEVAGNQFVRRQEEH